MSALTSAQPTGVVLDEPLARALLLEAFEEHLVPGDENVGDGFPRGLRARRLSPTLTDTAREQVILGGKVFVPFWVPPDWEESLSALGIVPVPPKPARDVEARQLDADVLFGMLAQRGSEMTAERWDQVVANLDATIQRWQRVEPPGAEHIDVGLRNQLALAMGQPSPFSDEQLRAWDAMQVAYEALKPALRCINDFSSIVATSLELGALSSVPVRAAGGNPGGPIGLPGGNDAEQRIQLLRISCRQLQRLPAPVTLRETFMSPDHPRPRPSESNWRIGTHGFRPTTLMGRRSSPAM